MKRERGRPKKRRLSAHVSGTYGSPAQLDPRQVAWELRELSDDPQLVIRGKSPYRDYFRQMVNAIADAVEEGDATRAGHFAYWALKNQQLNLVEAFRPLVAKAERALAADERRSRTQKIRRS